MGIYYSSMSRTYAITLIATSPPVISTSNPIELFEVSATSHLSGHPPDVH